MLPVRCYSSLLRRRSAAGMLSAMQVFCGRAMVYLVRWAGKRGGEGGKNSRSPSPSFAFLPDFYSLVRSFLLAPVLNVSQSKMAAYKHSMEYSLLARPKYGLYYRLACTVPVFICTGIISIPSNAISVYAATTLLNLCFVIQYLYNF